mgnify:CR=1 FL=1
MPWIEKSLGSIDFSKYKVIVVDNNSSDDTVKYVLRNYPQIKLIEQNKNIGFGQANNKGISYALNQGAEQVFLLNQDAYLVEDCLDKLINFQQNNLEYGILSPIHTNAKQNKLDRNFSNFLSYNKNSEFYSDHVLNNSIKPVYDVPFVNAAGWLINKKCLMTVGGFDPIFFHYGEDDNFCQRVLYHNFKIGVVLKTFIIHDRENRNKPNLKPFSDEFFKLKERQFKVRYADINKSDAKTVDKEIFKIIKLIVKAGLKLQFKRLKALKRDLKRTRHNIKLIKRSYNNNQTPSPHYLKLD